MNPQDDDPEARIRELERPLTGASELGTGSETVGPPPTQPWSNTFPPPPPHAPPAPWPGYADHFPPPPPSPRRSSGPRNFLIAVAVIGFLIPVGIGVYLVSNMFGGSGTTADTEPTTAPSRVVQTPTARPPQIPSEIVQTPAPGEVVIVSGIGENRTIACSGNAITVSGIENTVQITGNCASLTVSGIENVVTVDAADTIGVSGFENRVTFHTGQPDVANSGQGNTVEQG